MITAAAAVGQTYRGWRARALEAWAQAGPRTRTAVQLAVFFSAVVGAYSFSLRSLLANLGLDTPLAYTGLVPLIAVALALAQARQRPSEVSIHDRQVDYIIGLPLIAIAIAINLGLPGHLSVMFWVWRVDLLSLPVFVAGVVAIVFGTRVLWRQKLAVAYLLLAWPELYSSFLNRGLSGFTHATLAGLRAVVGIVPVAKPIASSDGSLFQVSHHGLTFPLSVVSACSGVNGLVGFLLVGAAFSAVVKGPRLRKTAWLLMGMAFLWLVNIGRLLFIFTTGAVWGEHFAIDVLHPYVGLVTFSLGVLVMMALLGPMGLTIGGPGRLTALQHPNERKPPAVPRIFTGAAIVTVAALVLGTSNFGLKAYNLVADAAGEPRLASYSAYPASPPGWQARYSENITWAKPYFGEDSTWLRYTYVADAATAVAGGIHADMPITADVVDTTDLGSFSAYGVQACYQFHGFLLRNVANVDLGGGIKGQTLSFSAQEEGDWTVVTWVMPVSSNGPVHYQRVILYVLDASGHVVAPAHVTGVDELSGQLTDSRTDRHLRQVRSFLVTFARQVVAAQAHVRPGSVLPRARSGAARRLVGITGAGTTSGGQ